MNDLYRKLKQISAEWMAGGLPTHEQMVTAAESLEQWKRRNAIASLSAAPVRIVTATLDDGIGQGIGIINMFSEVMGLQVIHLGLVQPPETIIAACRTHQPELLGLTVLQQDSEDDLMRIGRALGPETRLVTGGAAFKYDPEMAGRCGVDFVAENVAVFMDYTLDAFSR